MITKANKKTCVSFMCPYHIVQMSPIEYMYFMVFYDYWS